jgi:hypothetical protein
MQAQQSHATELARLSPLARQQLRELGDVGGDAPRLVAGEQVRRHPSAFHCWGLVERFQNSNHMGRSKRPHSIDGKSKMQFSDFMESVV